ncbi:MAG: peptidoglycan-binding domain-containing protein [Desulfobacterales bacterium]|nr:peptidoglycan-binding domain-containing protein [Desulfobacterales bacterium]
MKHVVITLTIICLVFFVGCGQNDKTEKSSSNTEEKLRQAVEAVMEQIEKEKKDQTEDAIVIETVKDKTNQTVEAVKEETAQIDLPNPPTIEEVQSILEHLGYEPGPIDGILGPRTENAVKKFLNDQGILQNFKIDNNFILLLRNAKNK